MPKINVYVPDQLAAQLKTRGLPVSAICQEALRRELARLHLKESTAFDEVTVAVGEPAMTVGFLGRWLVFPDGHGDGVAEDGRRGGPWGVALTKRNRIAVYRSDTTESATLNDYDSLAQAARELPVDVVALAGRAIGEEKVIWRDI
jgi:post-segregation antitoxin (ccd killing protein)